MNVLVSRKIQCFKWNYSQTTLEGGVPTKKQQTEEFSYRLSRAGEDVIFGDSSVRPNEEVYVCRSFSLW